MVGIIGWTRQRATARLPAGWLALPKLFPEVSGTQRRENSGEGKAPLTAAPTLRFARAGSADDQVACCPQCDTDECEKCEECHRLHLLRHDAYHVDSPQCQKVLA